MKGFEEMIRLYNQTPDGSEIKGWEVFTKVNQENTKKKSYSISLSGADRGIFIALDRNNYENLTIVDAGRVFPDTNKFTKLYSIHLGEDRFLPVITAAENDSEDRNILLFNYETNTGEVITEVNLINMAAISSFVTNKDFKTRVTIAAIDLDNKGDFGIEIKYGFNGGKVHQIEKIMFASYNSIVNKMKNKSMYGNNAPLEYFNISKSHESGEKIVAKRLDIPRIDLSKFCLNLKNGD
jgi:hypothetical protein